MFRAQKGFSILAVIILLALLGIAAYFLWGKPISQPTSTPPSGETSNDETTNWQTYRNEKYGFIFKHPQEWVVDERAFGGIPGQPPYYSATLQVGDPKQLGMNYPTSPPDDLEIVISTGEVGNCSSSFSTDREQHLMLLGTNVEKCYTEDPVGPIFSVRAEVDKFLFSFFCSIIPQSNEEICEKIISSFQLLP